MSYRINGKGDSAYLSHGGSKISSASGPADSPHSWRNAALQFWEQLQALNAENERLVKELGNAEQLAERAAVKISRIDVIGQNGNTGEHYEQDDPVNHPKHYQFSPGIEAIQVIEAILTTEQFRGYLVGNALKYRLRAGDKGDALQDIAKANWYQDKARGL